MQKFYIIRMERLPLDQLHRASIKVISKKRMMHMREMDADLMRPSR